MATKPKVKTSKSKDTREAALWKYIFTWNSTLHYDGVISKDGNDEARAAYRHITKLFEDELYFKDYHMQLECGDASELYYIQGRFELVHKKTKTSVLLYFETLLACDKTMSAASQVFTVQNLTLQRELNKDASIRYSTKPDTRVPDTEPATHHRLPAVYLGEDVKFLDDPSNRYFWQDEVLRLTSMPADSRKIFWIYDKEGHSRQVDLL
uniref:Uncharacterized protein n=2 Tax=Pavlovaceae TaxID=418969 RepID=M1JZY6_DIALT|nr:hypothetical protein H907_pgp108 [Diacronema lutheri]YP_009863743.1 hypothetical protein [Pavlova sp. NIVA-4/92]AGE93722.1 hypothetical protein [Diacronema lutheri]QKE31074.1 hypothetical protein [Pavlova sp. NIVA-4/92]|mmetsp:Transcript_11107/g.35062  ORF Transcript_11107/g.35062 Transcript_11107/m.35062 type:complete len:209 (-) Transcript_11107:761-1387(-)